jgi:hypothetical protein
MESKKQLIIVPPMSEPLQKLNEVLQGIASDEAIDISMIDEASELNQFIGVSGQCLVVFSTPKKCATFLQENRSVLAKTHSKVILLTPKEIPVKTLVKFVKLGLTESILDSSPPKTLLYKIKLLLRSIKSSTSQQDNKDQVVKSMIDANHASNSKNDNEAENVDVAKEESLNYLKKDPKNKKDKGQNELDYEGTLKGKSNFQEDSIDTNWKSKRKIELSEDMNGEEGSLKAESDGQSDIDMYYRGKKKKNDNIELDIEEDRPKKTAALEDLEEDLREKRKLDQFEEMESTASNKKRSQYVESEEEDFILKPESQPLDLDSPEETLEKIALTESEKEEKQKKELDEFEALLSEAKKRQKENSEDLGGHYKGKINNSQNEEYEEDAIEESKQYDNSDLKEDHRERRLDLDDENDELKEKTLDNENNDDKEDQTDGSVDHLNSNMLSDKGSTDKLSTYMKSEREKKGRDELESTNEINFLPKKKNELSEEDESPLEKQDNNLIEAASLKKKNNDSSEEDNSLAEKQIKLDLEPGSSNENDRQSKNDLSEEEKNTSETLDKLQLIDGELESQARTKSDEAEELSLKKSNLRDPDMGPEKENMISNGKVDKIDTFYRNGKGKKTEHSWDNLTDKSDSINFNLEKGTRSDGNTGKNGAKNNAGEITIDYRKLKEEFEYIARNGTAENIDTQKRNHTLGLADSEDQGSFKVIEVDARGFEFGIEVVNLIYQKETKPIDFYKLISTELISQYSAYPIFYSYKTSTNQHTEAFDSFAQFDNSLVSLELKEWWNITKANTSLFHHYFDKTMTTWLCREIPDKSGNGQFWEDVELPSWAINELKDKKVEMIFPYFDGVERMGVAILFFPFGVNPSKERSLTVTLEMVRTILLDSIQRKINTDVKKSTLENEDVPVEGKKNIISLFSGFFKRNKAS